MKCKPLLIILGCVALITACRSQNAMDEIAKSHIEGNVPKGKLFDEYLRRDLASYFCKDTKDCKVDYELLRDGPTQTGIAYPKFYVWIKCRTGKSITDEGAVRVAAIEQKQFEVTNYLSREEIVKSPSQIGSVFPAALVDKIVQKAGRNR